jgi:glutathione-regulated potassium-efflux system ancillary protein KefG
VAQYLDRYPEMPRPVVDLGRGRPRLWLRSEIGRWVSERQDRRRHKQEDRQ